MAEHQTGLSVRLKESTWVLHQEAEGQKLQASFVNGTAPRETYVEWLAQMCLLHRALEAGLGKLVAAAPTVANLVPGERLSSRNIEGDLRHFGADPTAIAPSVATQSAMDDMRRLATEAPYGLLGSLYVLEGSKNGNRFIARALRSAYALPDEAGTSYLDPHGDDQRPLWNRWKADLDALELTPAQAEDAVAAARNMFRHVTAISREIVRGSVGVSGH